MSLVFAGVCSHAPGITGRAARADARVRDAFYAKLDELRLRLEAAKPDALIVVAAEHFANFFMNNMPAYCIGMGDHYDGPIEDEQWLAIKRHRVPGNAELSRRVIERMLPDIDVAYAEEWKFDHGIMVPLHFLTPRYDLAVIPVNVNCQGPPLTPLKRAYEFGRVLRRACDAQPERIALIGTGGISHWPATPDSGTINEAVGPAVPRALSREPARRARRLHGRGDVARRGAGRLRDPHVPHGRRRHRRRDGRAAVLCSDPHLRRRLHGGADGGALTGRGPHGDAIGVWCHSADGAHGPFRRRREYVRVGCGGDIPVADAAEVPCAPPALRIVSHASPSSPARTATLGVGKRRSGTAVGLGTSRG